MDLTIKKILAIDSEAEEYRKKMDEILTAKKRELEIYNKAFENEYNDETENMREKLTEMSIYEANKATEEMKSSKQVEIEKLINLYKVHKDSFVNEIFKYIKGEFICHMKLRVP